MKKALLTRENGFLSQPSGETVYSGEALDALEATRKYLKNFCIRYTSKQLELGQTVQALDLKRLGYFKDFPHLATWLGSLKMDPKIVESFIQGRRPSPEVHELSEDSGHYCLAPTVCHRIYPLLENEVLNSFHAVTAEGRCFRREENFEILRRQYSFLMREYVCWGTHEEVVRILTQMEEGMLKELQGLGLRVESKKATDIFFAPESNPKYKFQKLFTTKKEILYDNLAIASFNFHSDSISNVYNIQVEEFQKAYSACAAMGVERFLYMFVMEWGVNAEKWPLTKLLVENK